MSWSGRHRPSLDNLGVYPRPLQLELPIRLAVGGTPESVVRAGRLSLPLALAIIGGRPEHFVPFADLYRDVGARAGHTRLPLSLNSHTYLTDTSQRAADEY